MKSETVVELFCRKSPGGVSHLPQRPQRSSPCLIRPPSRRGLFAVFPAVSIPALVSFVLACGGASSAPTPRLLGASLPLRRYVRRVGVGTWPRGAVFPAFPVVHEDIMFTCVNFVKNNVHFKKQIGYKKITPHLVARYRASPGPAEKRRRGGEWRAQPAHLTGGG